MQRLESGLRLLDGIVRQIQGEDLRPVLVAVPVVGDADKDTFGLLKGRRAGQEDLSSDSI